MEGLTVESVYTTRTEGSSSIGAMTLTCRSTDGKTIKVRTVVLHEDDDNNKPIVTEDAYIGKTIDIRGYGDYFLPEGKTEGEYQIKIMHTADIIVH